MPILPRLGLVDGSVQKKLKTLMRWERDPWEVPAPAPELR